MLATDVHRRILIATVVVSACATDPDPRPATADYIIEAILVPYCGRGGCHSSNTAARNLVFDTIDGALAAMKGQGKDREPMVTPFQPDRSRLVLVLTDSSRAMPPDVPLPDKDVALISRWVADGAVGLR